MDKQLFLSLFKDKYLFNLIFKHVYNIFINILKVEKTFKWKEVIGSEKILASYGYIDLLRNYYKVNQISSVELSYSTSIIPILKSNQLNVLKFLIKEFKLDITPKFFYRNDNDITVISSFGDELDKIDFYTLACQFVPSLDIIRYLDEDTYFKDHCKWDYEKATIFSPLSGNIELVKYLIANKINRKLLSKITLNGAIGRAASIGSLDIFNYLLTLLIEINDKSNSNQQQQQQYQQQQQQQKNILFLKSYSESLLLESIKGGNIEILKIVLNDIILSPHSMLLDFAADYNQFEMMKWIQNNVVVDQEQIELCTYQAMDYASINENLEMIKWLHENRTEGCSEDAMDMAAQVGNLEIIKWLHENRTEGCTTRAMDYTAHNGDLEMVKWLHANRTEGCTESAMDLAAQNGHLDLVKWLHHNRTEGCTSDAMDYAAQTGQLEVLIWLDANRTEGCSPYALVYASRNQQTETIKWLNANKCFY